jgi:uncharacterized protein (DUF1697 family)
MQELKLMRIHVDPDPKPWDEDKVKAIVKYLNGKQEVEKSLELLWVVIVRIRVVVVSE